MLEKSIKAIPHGYDKLFERRHIQAIKNTVFARKTHQDVCGALEPLGIMMKSVGATIKNLTTASPAITLSTGQLMKIKQLEDNMSDLRTYSTSVHGCNIILRENAP